MKVVLITNAWRGGGVGSYAYEMYKRLPDFGIEVEVLTLRGLLEEVREPKVHKIIRFSKKRFVWAVPYVISLLPTLTRIKHDLTWTMGFPESLGPLLTGDTFVLTKHGIWTWSDAKALRRKIWDRIVNRSQRIIVPTFSSRMELLSFRGKLSDKICVIHHGIDHNKFRPDKKAGKAKIGHGIYR